MSRAILHSHVGAPASQCAQPMQRGRPGSTTHEEHNAARPAQSAGLRAQPERPPLLAQRCLAPIVLARDRCCTRRDQHDSVPASVRLLKRGHQGDLNAEAVRDGLERHVVAPLAQPCHPRHVRRVVVRMVGRVAAGQDEAGVPVRMLLELRDREPTHERVLVLRAPKLIGQRAKLAVAIALRALGRVGRSSAWGRIGR